MGDDEDEAAAAGSSTAGSSTDVTVANPLELGGPPSGTSKQLDLE